jgi:hypothetical protein
MRKRNDNPMQVSPIPRPSAHIQDAISGGPAPTACAAWNTMTALLVNPTSTVTKPATTAETEISRRNDMSIRAFLLFGLSCAWRLPRTNLTG